MSYEQIEDLKDRISLVPNDLLPERVDIRIRHVPDMSALGGEVHKIAGGAVANG